MKKFTAIILIIISLSLLIVGCEYDIEEYRLVETLDEPENYYEGTAKSPETMPEIIPPTDYSIFLGGWYNYFVALITYMQITEINENEITFDMIQIGGESEIPSMIGPYTLPIVDNQVHWERSRITSEDDWFKSHNTLIFSGDEIFWMWESSWSHIRYDGTVHSGGGTIGIRNGEFYVRFQSLDTLSFGYNWQEWLEELRRSHE